MGSVRNFVSRNAHVWRYPSNRIHGTAAAGFSGPHHTLKLLISDYDAPGSLPLTIKMGVGAGFGRASVLRLTAASPSAPDGVRISGREAGADGSWREPAGEPGSLKVPL